MTTSLENNVSTTAVATAKMTTQLLSCGTTTNSITAVLSYSIIVTVAIRKELSTGAGRSYTPLREMSPLTMKLAMPSEELVGTPPTATPQSP